MSRTYKHAPSRFDERPKVRKPIVDALHWAEQDDEGAEDLFELQFVEQVGDLLGSEVGQCEGGASPW